MKIKTTKLQQMVSKAIKCASNNKLIPMTGLMGIEVADSVLSLICTDATNYVKVSETVEGEPFYVTVSAELFAKLVSKITSDEIEITVTENAFVVKGNGEYKLDIQLDEDGTAVKFPNKFSDYNEADECLFINKNTIDKVLNTNKSALATTMEIPCYTGYYFGEHIVSTDTFKITCTDIKVFPNPCLISSQAMELLSVFDDERVNVYMLKDKVMVFHTPNVKVYTIQLDGIEDFAIEAIMGLVETEFPSVCKFTKQSMINLLERISLFISPYDSNCVKLTFAEDGVRVSSKKSNGSEIIKYTETSNYKPFECSISVELLMSQLKSQSTDVTELWYGNDTAIKMCSDDVTQIVALVEAS